MKKISFLIVLFYCTNYTLYAQEKQDTTAVKKLILAMSYSTFKAVKTGQSINMIDSKGKSEATFNDYENQSNQTTNEEKMTKLMQEHLNSDFKIENSSISSNVYFKFPTKSFDKNTSLKLFFDEIINANGENVVEPLSNHELNGKSGFSFIANDDYSFSMDLLTKDNVKVYAAKGKGVLSITSNMNKIELDPKQINKKITFEGVNYTILKVNSQSVLIEADKENEEHKFVFLNSANKMFTGYSSMSFGAYNPFVKDFENISGDLTEKELDALCKKYSMKMLEDQSKKSKDSGIHKYFSIGGIPAKILIEGSSTTKKFNLPFSIKADDVKLIEKPIPLSTLGEKAGLFINPDDEQPYNDTTDLQNITSVVYANYNIDEINDENRDKLFDKIEIDAILKFKNIESLTLRYTNKTNVENLFEKLSQLEYLKELTIKGYVDETTMEEPVENTFSYLTSIPKSIGKLKKLESLTLENHAISTLPDEIAALKNLKSLDLRDNFISIFPASIFNCKNLENLTLADNFITTIPNGFLPQSPLSYINIDNNCVSTSLPVSLLNNENIRSVVNNNNLTTFFANKTPKIKERFEGYDNQVTNVEITEKSNYENKKLFFEYMKTKK